MTPRTWLAGPLLLVLALPHVALGQSWMRALPDPGVDDVIIESREAPNGDVIVLGRVNFESWHVAALDASGAALWRRELPDFGYGRGYGLWVTSAGVIVVVGAIWEGEGWIAALDGQGTTLWSWRTDLNGGGKGGLSWEYFLAVRETADGGLVIAGGGGQDECDEDLLVYRIGAGGNLLWDARVRFFVDGTDVLELPDGSFLACGASGKEFRIAKLDSAGNLLWKKSLRDNNQVLYGASADLMADGDIVMVSTKYPKLFPDGFLVLRLDPDGNLVWQRRYPGPGDDKVADVVATPDGGCVVVGTTSSFGLGDQNLRVMRLDAAGDIVWQRFWGGPQDDEAVSVSGTADGGFLVSGRTRNVTGGEWDSLLLRLDAAGQVTSCPAAPSWAESIPADLKPHVPPGDPGPLGDTPFPMPDLETEPRPQTLAVCLGGVIGTPFCGPATPNSSGASAVMHVAGSTDLVTSQATLVATDLPRNVFGYFLTGMGMGTTVPPGSQGTLCLLGSHISRYAKQVQKSGKVGAFGLTIDPNAIPGHGPIFSGETWNFQAWFRDSNPGSTSNFTDAVAVTFL